MMRESATLTQTSWKSVRERIKSRVDASLFPTLEEFFHPREDDPSLWLARYPYSELIVDQGKMKPPPRAKAIDLRKFNDLKECGNPEELPIGIVLEECVEVFMEQGNHETPANLKFYPLQLIETGSMFGVFETLDQIAGVDSSEQSYSICAGSRSIHILNPNLDEKKSFLKAFVEGFKPNLKWTGAQPHFELVKECAERRSCKWCTEILFMPRRLFRGIEEHVRLVRFLYRLGWRQATHTRRRVLTPTDLMNHIIQHLESLKHGQLPAHVSTFYVNKPAGPFKPFQDELKQVLPKYYPFILQPKQLQERDKGFYSFTCAQPAIDTTKYEENAKWEKARSAVEKRNLKGFSFFNKRTNHGGASNPAFTTRLTLESVIPTVAQTELKVTLKEDRVGLAKTKELHLHTGTGFLATGVLIEP